MKRWKAKTLKNEKALLGLAVHRKGVLVSLDRRIDAGRMPGGNPAFLLVP